MSNEPGEAGARGDNARKRGRADYEKPADREAKPELSSIVAASSFVSARPYNPALTDRQSGERQSAAIVSAHMGDPRD
jgi:hypothetical protein